MNTFVYTLCLGVEDLCGPAVDEPGVPWEPQHHQQNEESQDIYLSKRHGPQQTMLLTDHVIGGDVLLCLHGPTAPGLLEAGGIAWEKSLCHLGTQKHSWRGKKFLDVESSLCQYN